MRTHYDFSKMKARRNPYVKLLKQAVTIRLDRETECEDSAGMTQETPLARWPRGSQPGRFQRGYLLPRRGRAGKVGA